MRQNFLMQDLNRFIHCLYNGHNPFFVPLVRIYQAFTFNLIDCLLLRVKLCGSALLLSTNTPDTLLLINHYIFSDKIWSIDTTTCLLICMSGGSFFLCRSVIQGGRVIVIQYEYFFSLDYFFSKQGS